MTPEPWGLDSLVFRTLRRRIQPLVFTAKRFVDLHPHSIGHWLYRFPLPNSPPDASVRPAFTPPFYIPFYAVFHRRTLYSLSQNSQKIRSTLHPFLPLPNNDSADCTARPTTYHSLTDVLEEKCHI